LRVELYSTENKEKSNVIERWHRKTIERMWKHFTANSTQKYIDVLDSFVRKYNISRHSSIKMTPAEASNKQNEVTVFRNLYPDLVKRERRPTTAKFEIGDKVQIHRTKELSN